MEIQRIAGKPVALYPARDADAPLVVLNGEGGEGEAVRLAVEARTGADFALAVIGGLDWDDALTPWPAPGIRRGANFGGGADRWLEALLGEALPAVERQLGARPRWTGLAGYSLAGLFAVYALHRTDAFRRAASASGSLWYPGFEAYAAGHALRGRPERLYLSVGDREAQTRNPVMRPVEDATRRLAALYAERGVETRFELNPGGHFCQPAERLAKGIAWMLGETM